MFFLILISHLLPCVPCGNFSSGSSIKDFYAVLISPMYAICAAHPMQLEFIAQIIFEESYVSERKYVVNM
jgi:hypothetical protein